MERPMHIKYRSGEITYIEYYAYLEECKKRRLSGEKSAFRRFKDGEISNREYFDRFAQRNGYKDMKEYRLRYSHLTGRTRPINENKECSCFLGVFVAETLLSKMFHDVKRMPTGHPGYDFICSKGLKIDVKSSCLIRNSRGYTSWRFKIQYNKAADYFLMIGFNNRDDLQPQHIWLIKGTDIIKTLFTKLSLNDRENLVIQNSSVGVGKYVIYERADKLVHASVLCEAYKSSITNATPPVSQIDAPNLGKVYEANTHT